MLVGGGWGIFRLTIAQPLLGGGHDHDFGVIELRGEPVLLDHTFSLTNNSSRPIEIRDVKTTCSCTVADIETPYTIAAGETLDVMAKLNLKSHGHKLQRIFLNCGPDGVDTLRLHATGRNKQRLILPSGGFMLEPGTPVDRLVIYSDYDSNDPPPPPKITPLEGVRAEFDTWEILRRRSRAEGFPARWGGRLTIEQTGVELPEPAEVILTVGADQTLRVPLDALAAFRPGATTAPENVNR